MIDNGKIPVLGQDNSDKIKKRRADEALKKQERPISGSGKNDETPPMPAGLERYQRACEVLDEAIEKATRRIMSLLHDHAEDVWRAVGVDGERMKEGALTVELDRNYAIQAANAVTDALNGDFTLACLELVPLVCPDGEPQE